MNRMPLHQHRNERGSLLITAAVAAAVIAILIAGMLTYISNEYRLNLRSHRWTQTLYLAEAGVDIAFAEVNNYYVGGTNYFSTSRGWVSQGGGTYYRGVPAFTNAAGQNIGSITNYVFNVGGIGGQTPYIQSYAVCSTTPGGPVIKRMVQCGLAVSTPFPAGMVAKHKIDMNGQNVTSDSYDSSDVSKSTSGRYDATKRQANGDLASDDTITNSVDVNVANGKIYGKVLVSPNGSVTLGSGGSIGPTFVDSDRATTTASAQSKGWLRNDFQVDVPAVILPSGANSWTSQGNINNDATLTSGNYKASQINFSGSKMLTIVGDVTIYVTGAIDLGGQGEILITPSSKLTVYVAGSVGISGNGVVNNGVDATAAKFYGLDSSTSWVINGNGQWAGLAYAPNASLTIKGGGSSGDMSGAIVANSITMTGGTNFHYDEALRHYSGLATYNIASWKSYHWTGSAWDKDN